VEIIHQCSLCDWPQRIEDEGQHVTITACEKCRCSESIRHRPDPEPLPPERERPRFETIKDLLTAFMQATIIVGNSPDRPRIEHVHYSALDTVNFLFGYQARKTIMTGGRKK